MANNSVDDSVQTDRHPDSSTWWKHRRRHSYSALVGLFLLPVAGIVLDKDKLEVIMPLLQTLSWVFLLIIISYVVAATGEDIAKIRGAGK